MGRIVIKGPDGRTASLSVPEGASQEQILSKVEQVKSGWSRLGQFAQPAMATATPMTPMQQKAESDYSAAQAQPWRKIPVSAAFTAGDVVDMARSTAEATPIIGTFADEIEAALQQGLHSLTGGRMGAPYDDTLEYERAYSNAVRRDNPVASTVGTFTGAMSAPLVRGATVAKDIVLTALQAAGYGAAAGFGQGEGGLANRTEQAAKTGAVSGAVAAPLTGTMYGIQAIRRAQANMGQAGAYGKLADDMPGGVDEFANQVAAEASRNNVGINRRTLDILGEEMERAGGDYTAARIATVNRIAQEQGVTPRTAAGQVDRLTEVHRDSNLMLGEYPAVSASDAAQRLRAPGNVDLDELGRVQSTTTQAKMDYLANAGETQSAQNVRNAISLRQEDLGPSMRGSLENMAPRIGSGRAARPATIVDAQDMIDTAQRTAAAEYTAAYNGAMAMPQRLRQLPQFLNAWANRAATSAPEVAATIRNAVNQIAVELPNGQRGIQSLRQLQQGRTTLRGQINALERAGRNDLAREVHRIYRVVTRAMEQASPQWAQANRRWADMSFAERAQELGDALSSKAGPRFREQMQEFQALAPQAQDIVRIHFLQQLIDKLDNLRDTHAVSKLFDTDHARNMIRTLFGDEQAVAFVRAVRNQRVAERSQAMLGNSATHRRGQTQKQMDAETGLVAAVEQANVKGARNWLLERMTQILTERRNRPMADVLTTPMSDTARVAQQIQRMRVQQRRLREFDRPRAANRRVPATAGIASGTLSGEQ